MTDEERFIIARWAYSVGEPIISDAEYTLLLNKFQATKPDWDYVKCSWSSDPCPTALLKEYGYERLIAKVVLTEKTESIPSLNDWYSIMSIYKDYQYGEDTFVSYKHDGWNIQANYFNGNLVDVRSRGRSADALDVSVLACILPKQIPVQGSVRVVGECTCSKELFKTMKIVFNNALERSAVRTAIAHPEYTPRLSFHAFDIDGYKPDGNVFACLQRWGFDVPAYAFVSSFDDLVEKFEQFGERESSYGYPTDGLVIRSGSYKHALRVGAWEEPIYSTYVTGYEQSYGGHIISMNVLVKPIHTVKGMQYRLSLTNCKRIIENNLRKCYPIAFKITSSAYGDFDEEATRILQSQWAGREYEYCKMIDNKEAAYDNLANTGKLGNIQVSNEPEETE